MIKAKCFTMFPFPPHFLTPFSKLQLPTMYCFLATQDLCPCCSSTRNSLSSLLQPVNSCACFRSQLSTHLLPKLSLTATPPASRTRPCLPQCWSPESCLENVWKPGSVCPRSHADLNNVQLSYLGHTRWAGSVLLTVVSTSILAQVLAYGRFLKVLGESMSNNPPLFGPENGDRAHKTSQGFREDFSQVHSEGLPKSGSCFQGKDKDPQKRPCPRTPRKGTSLTLCLLGTDSMSIWGSQPGSRSQVYQELNRKLKGLLFLLGSLSLPAS